MHESGSCYLNPFPVQKESFRLKLVWAADLVHPTHPQSAKTEVILSAYLLLRTRYSIASILPINANVQTPPHPTLTPSVALLVRLPKPRSHREPILYL